MLGSGHAFSQAVHAANTYRPRFQVRPNLPSAPDRRDERATGVEPPRYRRGAGVSVTRLRGQGTADAKECEASGVIKTSYYYEIAPSNLE